MDEIQTISLRSEAKHILYLIDACYGGIASVGARGLDVESTQDYLQKITQYKSRQIISAGGRGEQVIEKSEWGHSAFTKNLLSGLGDSKADTDSDGIITAQELGTYLKKKVTIDSNNQQTPKTRNLSSDEGEFVFVYSENTAVIQDKSTDAKLDLLLSKIEKMESQKSNDNDRIVDKAVNGNSSWFEKYGYENRGIVFMALEDAYNIALIESLNKNSLFFIGYSQFGDKSMKRLISIQDGVSVTSQMVALGLNYMYYLTDKINPFISGVVGYMKTSWQDTNQNNDGDFNIIIPAVACGLALNPFQLDYENFPIHVSVQVSLNFSYLPSSYEFDINGNAILNDWNNAVYPGMSFGITIPK